MAAPAQIDCDAHPAVPSLAVLMPYLDSFWQEQISVRGIEGMELATYPPGNPLSARADWRPAKGRSGASLDLFCKHVLGDVGSDIAICNILHGAPAFPNIDFNAALCRAINEWFAREWLDREPKLRGSILVPLHNAAVAVDEIERCAADPRFVQVLLVARSEIPWGRRENWPIYACAERHRLMIGIHAGSTYRHPPTMLGWPSYFIEDYAGHAQAFQAQLLSLIYEGVFEKFPGLRFVLQESGVSWLPSFLWRAVSTWKAMRMEVPWVSRSPAELVAEHIRLTTQPFDVPHDSGVLEALFDQLGTDRLLLFSSDYPHWQFDGNSAMPGGLSADLVRRIAQENPLETYPRLKEAAQ